MLDPWIKGKLNMVKQEMARVNINILGISEFKWTGMGKFNSDDNYVYYCGQESFRRDGIALIVNKRVQNAVLWWNLKKWQNDLCSFSRQTIQHHSNPSLCHNHLCRRSWSWWVLWKRTRPSITNTKKRCPFHNRELEYKSRSQEKPGVTGKFVRGVQNEAGQRLTVLLREHAGHSKHDFTTTQMRTWHMDITRWSILKSYSLSSLQLKMEKLYTVSKNKTWSWPWLRSWAPYCKIQVLIEVNRENH